MGRDSASREWKRTRGWVIVLKDVEEVTIVESGEGRMRLLGIIRWTVMCSCSVLQYGSSSVKIQRIIIERTDLGFQLD